MPDKYDLIVIGTGLAGYTLAREFRKLDKQSSMLLISRDDGAFYSKPMLSNALASHKSPAQLIMKAADAMRNELNAEILVATDVTAIEPAGRCIRLDNRVLEYRQLVLAVGASPRQLVLQGDAGGQIYSVNSLQDYRAFHAGIQHKRRVAVIGNGLVGCEFANDLLTAGYTVHVIGPGQYPLGRLLPAELGQRMQVTLAGQGIHWHPETTAHALRQTDNGLQLQLDNDEQLEVDVVLSAIGLSPNIALAEQAGLSVARAIMTDKYACTSNPAIFALGDCAQLDEAWLPFVMPIMHSARALAKTLTGTPTAVVYPVMPVVVKTPAFPLVVTLPPPHVTGHWSVETVDNGMRALYKDAHDQLHGFILSEDCVKEKQQLLKQMAE